MRPAFPIVADQSVLDAPFISDNGGSTRELESPELNPALLGAQPYPEHQSRDGVSGDTSPGLGRPQSHGGKGRLDRIGGPDVNPMLCREVIAGQQRFSVPL